MKETISKLSTLFWCMVGGMFLILMIILGALAVYGGIKDFVLAKASQSWPSTTGRVISSSIKVSSSRSTGSRAATPSYSADIRYEYTINGQVFNNDDVSYGELLSSDKSDAQRIVDRYPIEKTVTVYYSPDGPDESLLELGEPGGGAVLKLGVGSFFMLIGMGLVGLIYRAWKSGKRS